MGEVESSGGADADPVDDVRRLLRAALRRLQRSAYASTEGDRAEEIFADIEDDLDDLAVRMWRHRQLVENRLQDELTGPFLALDSMLLFAGFVKQELAEHLQQDSVPASIRDASVLLANRSLGVGHELMALSRAGFPMGAQARWRTLFEVRVVAAVLKLGNRGTAARYLNHRYVLLHKNAQQLDPNGDTDPATIRELARLSKLYIQRHGKHFEGNWGWAAELSKRRLGVPSPNFSQLMTLVGDIELWGQRYQLSHHAIHGYSTGGMLSLDEEGLLRAGPTVQAVPHVVLGAVYVIGETMDDLLGMWEKYRGGPPRYLRALRVLGREISVSQQINALIRSPAL